MSSEFIYPNNTPFFVLECEEAFNNLTEREKQYAHYLSRASWFGGLISLVQTSLESPLIFKLFHKLFSSESVGKLRDIAINDLNFTSDEYDAFLIYVSAVLYNMGNYKDFGDTKFIPNVGKDKFEKLLLASQYAKTNPQELDSLLSRCLEQIYSLNDTDQRQGFPAVGTTTYLSKNCTVEDDEIVKEFFKKHNLEAYNSRLFKTIDETGKCSYEIRLASVLDTDSEEDKDLMQSNSVNGHNFVITRGDYSKLLNLVNENLLHAKEYAANENEGKMLESFLHCFRTGSLKAHRTGSSFWVKDKGPIIESYIGFIETYRDPAGIRGEFEGFVAVVNKKLSTKFTNLVDSAENLLPLLPWSSIYEKDKFLQPDFTSLDILTFAGTPPPAGICIPNYDDIRQSVGFKNVFLGNVVQSRMSEPANYLSKSDQDMLLQYRIPAFTVNVALHELLGHGSGKLFCKETDGNFNFEKNEEISSWYDIGETFDSKFGDISSAYEECRAECVALYLSGVSDVLRIFGNEGAEAEKIVYIMWLSMIHSGLEGLQFYDPKTETWLQAHCRARYVILQVLLEAGQDFVKVERKKGEDGNPDLLLTMDRTKIESVGKPSIGDFLKKMQIYKSTANVPAARELFNKYSAVTSEDKYPFLDYREIVMARKKPRNIFVLSNTSIDDGKVKLKNYEAKPEGMVESFIERFQGVDVDSILEELWAKDKPHFS